jgi:hypothetical protein
VFNFSSREIMEAEQINAIATHIQDLGARAQELRRYL